MGQPCLVGIEAHTAIWNADLKKALEGLNVQIVQSTSDEAKGILAHVREKLGAHHSPNLFHLQQGPTPTTDPLILFAMRGG